MNSCARLDRRRIRAEAGAWIAKLHGPDRTPILEAALRRWLAENPAHAKEFELATDVWNESSGLPSTSPKPIPLTGWFQRHIPLLQPLTALAAVCLIIAGWFGYAWYDSCITTGIGEQKTVTLVDGTRVTLNTDTRLLVRYDQRVRRIVLSSGEAYFNVAHNEHWPFVVEVGDQKIVALGTSFMVRRTDPDRESVVVTLLEGRVAVAPLTEPDLLPVKPLPEVTLLSPGERLRTRTAKRATIESASIDQSTGWMHGQLMFDETPLREAVNEFNRYSSVKIKIGSAEVAKIPVGGVFRLGDSTSFARAVAEAHSLRLVAQGDEILLESTGIGPVEPTE